MDNLSIINQGIDDFFNHYRDLVYGDGTVAKIAVYCGKIETLEEQIYPRVAEIVSRMGMNPNEVILKYHKGNKKYPKSGEWETNLIR
jgi:type III restriction enzyme